jgi:flagellar biosynthesis/type III secretory pathway protein FliH
MATHHIHATIKKLLKLSNQQLADMFNMDGQEARKDLLERQAKGELLVGSENCEGFDPIKGCPGHESDSTLKVRYDELKAKYEAILATADGHSSQTENVWQSGYAAGHDTGYERGKREAEQDVIHQKKETVEEEWESFWKEIVNNDDGTINIEQVKKELADFSFVMEQVPKIYCHITGDKMSKVTYHADDVIREADNHYRQCFEEDQTEDKCRVNAEYLCTFKDFDQWVNKASSWIAGHRKGTVICIDDAGNLCLIGEDFMAARDFKLFPVKAYRMIKTIEAV